MKTCALLLAVTVAAAAFGGAQAFRRIYDGFALPPQLPTSPAITATCQAAHDVDARVNVTDCTTLLDRSGGSGADVRILAETAASYGVGRAYAAVNRINSTLEQGGGDVEPRVRRALELCSRLYDSASVAFKAARQAIEESRYGDVGKSLAGVPELGRQCESEYAAAGSDTPSPVSIFSGENEQFTYLTIALTSLIK